MVEDVRLDLAPAIGQADAQLTVEVAPDLLVSFSPANLLSNAVKYRAPDRPAQVLTMQDNGLGMSEVQQRQLFGLFQRLVENGGGTIAVASQPHVGTTFTVTFPPKRTTYGGRGRSRACSDWLFAHAVDATA